MLLTQITAPTVEPVDAADVRAHTKIDQGAEDPLLEVLIASARALAEAETGRQFVTATWEAIYDGFPCASEIVLPRPPLVSVSSVKYLDTSGTEQTWSTSNYVVEAPSGETAAPGRLRLAYGVSWPTTQCVARSVRVRYICGYGSASSPAAVPAGIRHAIMVGVSEAYKNREESIQGTISQDAAMTMARLLGPFRVLEHSWE